MPHGRLPEGNHFCRDRHYNQAIVRHSQVCAAALHIVSWVMLAPSSSTTVLRHFLGCKVSLGIWLLQLQGESNLRCCSDMCGCQIRFLVSVP
jgi:hypothetical protein